MDLVKLVARVSRAKTKESYHRAGRALLRAVAKQVQPTAKVTNCWGGPAVMGEISIQALEAGFWGQINNTLGSRLFMYRKASARDPYGADPASPNHWVSLDKLADPDFLALLAHGLDVSAPQTSECAK